MTVILFVVLIHVVTTDVMYFLLTKVSEPAMTIVIMSAVVTVREIHVEHTMKHMVRFYISQRLAKLLHSGGEHDGGEGQE